MGGADPTSFDVVAFTVIWYLFALVIKYCLSDDNPLSFASALLKQEKPVMPAWDPAYRVLFCFLEQTNKQTI